MWLWENHLFVRALCLLGGRIEMRSCLVSRVACVLDNEGRSGRAMLWCHCWVCLLLLVVHISEGLTRLCIDILSISCNIERSGHGKPPRHLIDSLYDDKSILFERFPNLH